MTKEVTESKHKFSWDNLDYWQKYLKNKTVSVIFPTYWPQTMDAYRNYGAMEVRTLEVVKNLAKLGCQVNVLAPKGSHLPIKNVNVLSGDYGSWGGAGVHPYNLEKNLVESNLDVLKASDAVLDDTHFRLWSYLKSKSPEEYPHTAWSMDFHVDQVSTLPLYPQNIICVSKWLMSSMREKFKNQGHKFWHAYSGLIRNNYPSEFDPSVIEDNLYLFLCRFSKVKSPHFLLQIAQENLDDKFVMMGDAAFCLTQDINLRCYINNVGHDGETNRNVGRIYNDIRRGMKIQLLSSDGKYYPFKIKSRDIGNDESLYKIELKNGKEIIVTENHRFPTQNGLKMAKDLTTEDNFRISLFPFKKFTFEGTFDIGRFLGLYIAEGHIEKKKRSQITFGFHAKEDNLIEFVIDFSKNYGAITSFGKEGNSAYVLVNSKILVELVDQFVNGQYSYTKRLRERVFLMNNEFRKGLWMGLLEGDGTKKTRVLTTTSKELMKDLSNLLESLGEKISVHSEHAHQDKNGTNHRKNYRIQVISRGKYYGSCGVDFVPIESIELHQVGPARQGSLLAFRKVYTIEMMSDNPIFILSGGIQSHNSNEPHYAMAIKNVADKMPNVKVIFNASYEEKIDYLQRSVGLLHPGSWNEPFGFDFVEGLYFGSKLLSFDRGAAREIYRNKEQGIIAPFTNNEAQNIDIYKRAFKIFKKLKVKPEDCRQRVLENFDFSVHSFPKYLDVLSPKK